MRSSIATVTLLLVCTAGAQQAPTSTWILDKSSLSYTMTHPVHEVVGTSRAAKGKGVCQAGYCDFLIAAPVKTFDSGDTNRDLHMLQVVRGAEYPIVTVRLRISEAATAQSTFQADLEITFAGQTARFRDVPFKQTINGQEHRIMGTVPSTLNDFKIDPPRFLTVPIHNEIPVRVDTEWHAQ